MAPFDLWTLFGTFGGGVAYLLIGFAFGFVLESSGFGDSRRLAGQFFFRDLSVARVMMTAILTAMFLVMASSSLGLVDFQDVYVNPTYLVPGIVGGLVMGVGFVIGGYCPGTSLAATGAGKIDGFFYVLGALFGMFLFGEVADNLAAFMTTTDWGRVTLDQTFGVSTAVAVLGAAGFGIGLFAFLDSMKKTVWKEEDHGHIELNGRRFHPAVLGIPAAVLLMPVMLYALPDADEAYALRADEYGAALEARDVHVHPAELLEYMYNDDVVLDVIDVRDESSYNLFHLLDASHVELDELDAIWTQDDVPNRLVVVASNDERHATQAWKRLTAMKVANVYVLDGGINHWLDEFGEASVLDSVPSPERQGDETLCHTLGSALGDRHHASRPSRHDLEHYLEHYEEQFGELERRVKLVTKARKGGGCG